MITTCFTVLIMVYITYINREFFVARGGISQWEVQEKAISGSDGETWLCSFVWWQHRNSYCSLELGGLL